MRHLLGNLEVYLAEKQPLFSSGHEQCSAQKCDTSSPLGFGRCPRTLGEDIMWSMESASNDGEGVASFRASNAAHQTPPKLNPSQVEWIKRAVESELEMGRLQLRDVICTREPRDPGLPMPTEAQMKHWKGAIEALAPVLCQTAQAEQLDGAASTLTTVSSLVARPAQH